MKFVVMFKPSEHSFSAFWISQKVYISDQCDIREAAQEQPCSEPKPNPLAPFLGWGRANCRLGHWHS